MATWWAVMRCSSMSWKTLVYELARWRNRHEEVIPQATIDKPPSAELRPGQLDTDSLPPYDTLDQILRGYIERDLSIAQIVAEGFDVPPWWRG